MKKQLWVTVILAALFSCGDKETDEMAGGAGGGDNIYFNVFVDGAKKDLKTIHYAREGKTIHLAAFVPDGFPNLNVTMTATSTDDFRGAYPYHYSMQQGTSIVLYGVGDADGYESHWWDCPPDAPLLVPSPGNVKIENIERVNGEEYITGSMDAEVYQPQGDCPYAVIKAKKITAQFRLKKAK